jgi:hypothetical protein
MRSMIRFLTITGLVAASASALAAQPRRPIRPLPPEPQQRVAVRERMLERRERMLERRVEMGLRAPRGGAGRMGMRPGGMGPRGAGLREGAAVGRVERRMIARRAVMRDRIASLKPEQREALSKYRESAAAERRAAVEEFRTGKATREQVRARIQKWRETHKPPVDLEALRRPIRPEGDR